MTQLLTTCLYTARKVKGFSQEKLAAKIGVTRNCIQQLECYEHLPTIETIFEFISAIESREDEIKEFLYKLYEAYIKDRAFQKEQEEEVAV